MNFFFSLLPVSNDGLILIPYLRGSISFYTSYVFLSDDQRLPHFYNETSLMLPLNTIRPVGLQA